MLIALVLATAVASTAGTVPSHTGQGDTGDIMMRYYPARARQLEVEGQAVIRCTSTPQGGVTDCAVVSETPEGWGFGAAALQMAPLFKLKTKISDGKPDGGGPVTIPVAFKLGPPDTNHSAQYALTMSMVCYAAYAAAADHPPRDPLQVQRAGYFGGNLIANAGAAGKDAAAWEALMAQARANAPKDETGLAASRDQCIRFLPAWLKPLTSLK